MSERRHARVVNTGEVEARTLTKGSRFGGTMRGLSVQTGARAIGCSLYEIDPGRRAFPMHFHCANEEAIYVLEGTGTLRLGKEEVAVRAGDWIALPVGPDHAHQLINDGDRTLRYLCVLTQVPTEVVGYPDSGKVGLIGSESPEARARGEHWLRLVLRGGEQVDYYDGEDIG